MIVRLSLVKHTHTHTIVLVLIANYILKYQFHCQFYALFSAELYVAFDQASISIVEGGPVANVCVSVNTSLTEIPIGVLLTSSDDTAIGEFT